MGNEKKGINKWFLVLILLVFCGGGYYLYKKNYEVNEKIAWHNSKIYYEYLGSINKLNKDLVKSIVMEDSDIHEIKVDLEILKYELYDFDRLKYTIKKHQYFFYDYDFIEEYEKIIDVLERMYNKEKLDEIDIVNLKKIIAFNNKVIEIQINVGKKLSGEYVIENFYKGTMYFQFLKEVNNYLIENPLALYIISNDKKELKRNISAEESLEIIKTALKKLGVDDFKIEEEYHQDDLEFYKLKSGKDKIQAYISEKNTFYTSISFEYDKEIDLKKTPEELKEIAEKHLKDLGLENLYFKNESISRNDKESIESAAYYYIKKVGDIYDDRRNLSIRLDKSGRVKRLWINNYIDFNEELDKRPKLSKDEAVSKIKESYQEHIENVKLLNTYDGFIYKITVKFEGEHFVYNIHGDTGEVMN